MEWLWVDWPWVSASNLFQFDKWSVNIVKHKLLFTSPHPLLHTIHPIHPTQPTYTEVVLHLCSLREQHCSKLTSDFQSSTEASDWWAHLVIFHHLNFNFWGIFYCLLQPLWRWSSEVWRAWVALSATTTTNPRGGRANVNRISSQIPFLCFIFSDEILLKISQQISVFPGCVAFAPNHSSEAAGAWKGRSQMERERGGTRSAPVIGLHLRVAEGILAIVILSWDNCSPSPSKMIRWVGCWFWKSKFWNSQGEHSPVPVLSLVLWDGRVGAEPQRAWHLPRAPSQAIYLSLVVISWTSLLLICIPTIWCKTFREEVEMEASENAPIG